MAFDTYESSRHAARPIKLFKFMLGPLPEDELRYTDAESVQAFENKDYQPIAISTGKMTANGTLDNSALTVNMQGNTELHNIFRIWPPSYVVGLIVYQGHSDDPDNQFLAAWGGRVINAAWPNNQLKLTCEPTTLSFRRSGLRRNYQRSCPHALYGPQCRAAKIALDTSCTEIHARNTIRVGSVAGTPVAYSNGTIEWVNEDGRREIMSVWAAGADGYLKLSGTPITLKVGMAVKLYKGCDHTMGVAGCGMHNNILNYGGQPWIPMKNPVNSLSEYT